MNTPLNEDEEQRKYTRIKFEGDAKIIQGEDSWPTQIHDLSLSGALLERPKDMPVEMGLICQLAFKLTSTIVVIEMEVEVAHLEDHLIGFRCLHIDLESVSHLRRLVELNIGDIKLLERELTSLLDKE